MFYALTAAALVAAVSANEVARDVNLYNFNSTANPSAGPIAKVVNRCSYPVYLWSIEKQLGCPSSAGLVLNTGDFYNENLRTTPDGGISIKLSKRNTCGGGDVTQLEYKLDTSAQYGGNYLDMSFVDCPGKTCPGFSDGFYLKAGNNGDPSLASAVNNEHCPIMNVYNAAQAAANAYIDPNDVQTKWCPSNANLELYLCGGDTPGASDPAPKPNTPASSPQPALPASPSLPAPVVSSDPNKVLAAAITPAPDSNNAKHVKTVIVTKTAYLKRHAHMHARRHAGHHA